MGVGDEDCCYGEEEEDEGCAVVVAVAGTVAGWGSKRERHD